MFICKNCNHELRKVETYETNINYEYVHKIGEKHCFRRDAFVKNHKDHVYCGCTKPELKVD